MPAASAAGDRPAAIALLDCYTGSNLGDAAILDAAIANLRERVPQLRLAGISLSNFNMESRHEIEGIALCCTPRPFYAMSNWRGPSPAARGRDEQSGGWRNRLKAALPRVWAVLRRTYGLLMIVPREIDHFVRAWRTLSEFRLLVVCGGGQIDDEWGGAWGHPFALFKWTVAARLAGRPVAVASVGVSRLRSRLSRLFIGAVLRLATYRSFRDLQSRELAARIASSVRSDAVVPDLAFAMPAARLARSAGARSLARGRPIVAVSPIAFGRPGYWPTPNAATYERYLATMKQLIERLLDRGYFLLFVWSSMPDDRLALSEILARFSAAERTQLDSESSIAAIDHGRWEDLAAALKDADLVIASRLHSVILSLLLRKPPVAISFDPKVDRLMEDFGDTHCLLDIRTFTADEVLERADFVAASLAVRQGKIDAFLAHVSKRLADQFDDLLTLCSGRT